MHGIDYLLVRGAFGMEWGKWHAYNMYYSHIVWDSKFSWWTHTHVKTWNYIFCTYFPFVMYESYVILMQWYEGIRRRKKETIHLSRIGNKCQFLVHLRLLHVTMTSCFPASIYIGLLYTQQQQQQWWQQQWNCHLKFILYVPMLNGCGKICYY